MVLFLMNTLLQPCDKVSKIIIIVKIEYRKAIWYLRIYIRYDVDLQCSIAATWVATRTNNL